jgi:hypothetical protein
MQHKKTDHRKVVPYTTKTGIQIGSMYQPKPDVTMSRDMERLQASLLNKPLSMVSRISSFWRYPRD